MTQSCVATGEPVEAEVDEPFDIVFRPQPDAAAPTRRSSSSESELDVVFYDGAAIDLGEAVAETLSLGLDPYPRAPDAEAALKAAGVKSEEEAGPFAALAALRDKLGNDRRPAKAGTVSPAAEPSRDDAVAVRTGRRRPGRCRRRAAAGLRARRRRRRNRRRRPSPKSSPPP